MSVKPLSVSARPYVRRVITTPSRRITFAFLFVLYILTLFLTKETPHYGASSGGEATLRLAMRRAASPQTNTLVLLLASATHTSLAHNAVCHLRRLGVKNYLVVALDARAFATLRARDIPVFLPLPAPAEAVHGATRYGTENFVRLSLVKTTVVATALEEGIDTLLTDVDIAWLSDVGPVLSAADDGESDIMVTSDSHPGEAPNHVLNSGLYLVRASPRSAAAFRRIKRYARAIRRSEQKAFNHVLCGGFRDRIAGPGARIGDDRCVLPGRRGGGKLISTVAALDQFPNGAHSAWNSSLVQLMAERRVVAMHANYLPTVDEKIERLKSMGLWLVDEGNGDATISDEANCIPLKIPQT